MIPVPYSLGSTLRSVPRLIIGARPEHCFIVLCMLMVRQSLASKLMGFFLRAQALEAESSISCTDVC